MESSAPTEFPTKDSLESFQANRHRWENAPRPKLKAMSTSPSLPLVKTNPAPALSVAASSTADAKTAIIVFPSSEKTQSTRSFKGSSSLVKKSNNAAALAFKQKALAAFPPSPLKAQPIRTAVSSCPQVPPKDSIHFGASSSSKFGTSILNVPNPCSTPRIQLSQTEVRVPASFEVSSYPPKSTKDRTGSKTPSPVSGMPLALAVSVSTNKTTPCRNGKVEGAHLPEAEKLPSQGLQKNKGCYEDLPAFVILNYEEQDPLSLDSSADDDINGDDDNEHKSMQIHSRAQDSQDDMRSPNDDQKEENYVNNNINTNEQPGALTRSAAVVNIIPTKASVTVEKRNTTPIKTTPSKKIILNSPPCSRKKNTQQPSSTPGRRNKTKTLADKFLKECLETSKGDGNLFSGGIGVAAYLRLKISGQEIEATKRKILIQMALNNTKRAMISAEQRGKFQVSLLTGEYIGAKCMMAAALYKLGKKQGAFQHAQDVIQKLGTSCAEMNVENCSVMHGRAGALQAIWFLRSELEDSSLGRDFALDTSTAILLEGLKKGKLQESNSLLMWQWHGRSFLGAAHGAVGILHSLLGHTQEEWLALDERLTRVKDVVRQAIDSLKELRHESGNLRATLDGFEEDKCTDWSHGSPGYCLLLIKAAEVFGDNEYLDLAKDMAEQVLWPRRAQSKGVGLARGITGVAYVFLSLGRVDRSNAAMWISRAEQVAHSAADHLEELLVVSKRPNSLFEGQGGFVSLLMDIQHPEDSSFPLYEFSTLHDGAINNSNARETTDFGELCHDPAGFKRSKRDGFVTTAKATSIRRKLQDKTQTTGCQHLLAPEGSPIGAEPKLTPLREQESRIHRIMETSSSKVFPAQRKHCKYTKSKSVSLAERTTASSRAKASPVKSETPQASRSPSVRRL